MSYVVMLDAGHGGWDPGASYYGRQEKNDNLNLALAVGNILEQKGIPVIYTRTSDVYQTPCLLYTSKSSFVRQSPRIIRLQIASRISVLGRRKILSGMRRHWESS